MKPMWAARSREHMVDAPAARKRRSRLLWSAGAVVPCAYGWAVSPMPALSRCTASSRPPSQLELNYSPTPGRVTEVSKASVTCTGRCPSEPRPRTPPRSCHACIGSLLCSNDGCWRSTRAGSGPTRSTTTSTNSPSASIGVTRAPVACSSTDCFTKPSGLRLTHTAHSSAAASTDPPPAPIAPESRSSGHCNEGDSPMCPNGPKRLLPLGRADHLDLVPVRVVDVKRAHALQHRVHTMPDLDPGFDESGLELAVLPASNPERQVVQHPLLLLPMCRIVGVRIGVGDEHDHLGDSAGLGDHQELVGHLQRREQLEPEPVSIELHRPFDVGDPPHDLGETFDLAHAATAPAIAARCSSRTRGGTEHPGARSSPRPPVSETAARASASILAGGP